MISLIEPVNLPAYAKLSNATVSIEDMGDRTITTQVKIDGRVRAEFADDQGADWEVLFNGDRYIHPLRIPQASKDNQSRYQTIDLTFFHWAIYQLKRYYYVALANVESGTPTVDKYIVPITVDLPNFAKAFDDILKYYFPGREIYVYQQGGSYINPALTDYDKQNKTIEIDYSYLWDVLQKTYELYDCRWDIERDSEGHYAIKFGYAVTEIQHDFEYGSEGGLMKVERQVQDPNIRNQILGRGGNRNLPYMYFKDYEKFHPNSDDERWKNYGLPDPDAIPELENILFTELRDSNFRSYVQGWKTNPSPNRIMSTEDGWVGTVEQYDAARGNEDWAYKKGHEDLFFDPVEYVKDDESIATYGLLQGGLANNEDIFPSLQGMELELPCSKGAHDDIADGHKVKTLADEIVDAEDVETDEINASGTFSSATEMKVTSEVASDTYEAPLGYERTAIPEHPGDYLVYKINDITAIEIDSRPFEVPEHYIGYIFDKPVIDCRAVYNVLFDVKDSNWQTVRSNVVGPSRSEKLEADIYYWEVYKYGSSQKVSATTGLEPGKYYVKAHFAFKGSSGSMRVYHEDSSPFWELPKALGNLTLKADFTVNLDNYSFNGEVIPNRIGTTPISETVTVPDQESREITLTGSNFTVPESGALMVECPVTIDPKDSGLLEVTVRVARVNGSSIEYIPNYDIPAGNYRLYVTTKVTNTSGTQKAFTVSLQPAMLYYNDQNAEWKPTFDVWIKNVFETNRADFPAGQAGDEQYMLAVWEPLVSTQELALTFITGALSASSDWEFKVARDGIAYDNSKSLVVTDEQGIEHEVRSEWRLTLIKSEAEADAIHQYVPYKGYDAAPYDRFFFTGIYMPWSYVYAAEKELNATKEAALLQTKEILPTWVVQLDKLRIQRGDEGNALALISRMHAGDKVTVKDSRYTGPTGIKLFIKSMTYTWTEPGRDDTAVGTSLPDVEVVLSDKVETSLSTVEQIQSNIEVLSSQLKGLTNLERAIRKVCDTLYLRKDGYEDTTYSPTKVARSIGSPAYRTGLVGGEGWSAYLDNNGDSVLEADRVLVRKDMQVNNLVINQVAAQGGREIVSAANLRISQVESGPDGYICYFDRHDGTIANLFQVDDIAMSQVFDEKNNETKYYKRRVVEVNPDYVVLSYDDVDGDGIPAVDDVLVQYGNYTDANRRYVIIRDVIGGGYERMLSNLSSVNSNGEEYYFAGMTNEAASQFVGLRDSNQNDLYDSLDQAFGYIQYVSKPRWFVGDHDGEYAEWYNGELHINGRLALTTQVESSAGTYTALSNYLQRITDSSYLTEALALAGATLAQGGLILTSMIKLGMEEAGEFKVYSGINGVQTAGTDIAAWYGGDMLDVTTLDPEDPDEAALIPSAAKSLFRFDGSGYLAGHRIYWGNDGSGRIPGVTWNQNGVVTFDSGIIVNSTTDETLGSILAAVTKLSSMFDIDSDGDVFVKPDGARNRIFYNLGGITALGKGQSGGGGGGASITVHSYADLVAGATFDRTSVIDTFNAYTIWDIWMNSVKKSGAQTITGALTANSFAIPNGQATGFLKANGSVDSNTYLKSSDISSWAKQSSKPSYDLDEVTDGATRKLANYLPLIGGEITGDISFGRNHGIKDAQTNNLIFNIGGISSVMAFLEIGNAGTEITLSTDNTNLVHKKNGISYNIWDASNFNPSNYLQSSDIASWAKAADPPTLDSVLDGSVRKLSNYLLKSGGQVGGNLIPSTNNTRSLGSESKNWKEIFVGDAYITAKLNCQAPAYFNSTVDFQNATVVGLPTSNAEWYNLKLDKPVESSNAQTLVSMKAIIENYNSALTNSNLYRMVLLRWRRNTNNRSNSWHAPFLTGKVQNNPDGFDDDTVIDPGQSIMEVCDASWAITGNRVQFCADSIDNNLNDIIPKGVYQNRIGEYMWKNTHNKKMRIGCAIFKKTNKGHWGWERISNIAEFELYLRTTGTSASIPNYVISTRT